MPQAPSARRSAKLDPRPQSAPLVEPLENRQLLSVSPLALGINANNVSAKSYKSIVSLLRASGTTTVRLWYGFSSYETQKPNNIVKFVEKFKHDGFDVTLSVVPEDGMVGTAAQTKSLFSYLVTIPGLTDAVDRWEIGNEEDSSMYWKGTLKQYVDQYLRPASLVLHAYGEPVVSGGVSWNPEDIRTLTTYGMLKWVDYVGYHPYRSSVADLKAKIADVKSIVGNVPLVATEWNVRGHESDPTKTAWAAEVAQFWPVIRDNFYAAYYFCAIAMNSPAGPAGAINSNGTPNEPFYSTYNAFQNSMPVTVTPTPTPSPTPSPTPTPTPLPTTSGSQGTPTPTHTPKPTPTPTPSPTPTPTPTSTHHTPTPTPTPTSTHHTPTPTPTSTHHTPTPTPTPVAVKRPKPVAPAISSVSLINADADKIVTGYDIVSAVVNIDIAQTGGYLSLLASASKTVASMKYTLNGSTLVDSSGPFTLFGEKHHNIVGGSFKPGIYTVTMQPFTGVGATGTAGKVAVFTLNVTNSNARPPVATGRTSTSTPRPTTSGDGTIGVLTGVKVAKKKKTT
ncbi:MAG: hypothetical protein ACTHM6_02025 [Tepidisphaeraceae bacterium]